MTQKVLTLVNGIMTEMALCCTLQLIILQKPNGDDIAFNPLTVEAVVRSTATRSTVRTSNAGNHTVAGTVAAVVAALTV